MDLNQMMEFGGLTSFKQILNWRGNSLVSDSLSTLKSITSHNAGHALVIELEEISLELYKEKNFVVLLGTRSCWNQRQEQTKMQNWLLEKVGLSCCIDMYSWVEKKINNRALKKWNYINSNNKLHMLLVSVLDSSYLLLSDHQLHLLTLLHMYSLQV